MIELEQYQTDVANVRQQILTAGEALQVGQMREQIDEDVYKRQFQPRVDPPQRAAIADLALHPGHTVYIIGDAENGYILVLDLVGTRSGKVRGRAGASGQPVNGVAIDVGPVSYTPLDVYKRQGFNRLLTGDRAHLGDVPSSHRTDDIICKIAALAH